MGSNPVAREKELALIIPVSCAKEEVLRRLAGFTFFFTRLFVIKVWCKIIHARMDANVQLMYAKTTNAETARRFAA